MRKINDYLLKYILTLGIIIGMVPFQNLSATGPNVDPIVLKDLNGVLITANYIDAEYESTWMLDVQFDSNFSGDLGLQVKDENGELVEIRSRDIVNIEKGWHFTNKRISMLNSFEFVTSIKTEVIFLRVATQTHSVISTSELNHPNVEEMVVGEENFIDDPIKNIANIKDLNTTTLNTNDFGNQSIESKVEDKLIYDIEEFRVDKFDFIKQQHSNDFYSSDIKNIDLNTEVQDDYTINLDLKSDNDNQYKIPAEQTGEMFVVDSIDKVHDLQNYLQKVVNESKETYKDPFEYMDVQEGSLLLGKYPVRNSNAFLGGSGSKTTKNYDYNLSNGIVSSQEPSLLRAYGETSSFENGYHSIQYGEGVGLLTKKTVKPTLKHDVFDVEVDIFGGSESSGSPIDIMFVLDDSSSMNDTLEGKSPSGSERWKDTRWYHLKNALNSLFDALLTEGDDIYIGMTNFGSKAKPGDTGKAIGVYSQIANFGTVNNPIYLTNNLNDLKSNSILDKRYTTSDSGTPTFMGLETGTHYLNLSTRANQDANVKTFIVLITDGLSNFGPSLHYFEGIKPEYLSNVPNTTNFEFYLPEETWQYKGRGYDFDSEERLKSFADDTVTRLETIKRTLVNHDFEVMGLGLGYQDEGRKFYLDYLMDKIVDGELKFDAVKESDLEKAINDLKQYLVSSSPVFVKGILVDPMSAFVTMVNNSLETYALGLTETGNNAGIDEILTLKKDQTLVEDAPSYAKNIEVNLENNQVTLSNMTLGSDSGKRNGIRLKYQVRLLEEFNDGKFYQTNGPTYAYSINSEKNVPFAIPSVRVPVIDLEFDKINERGILLDGVTFDLLKKNQDTGNYELKETQATTGKYSFKNLSHGDYILRETGTPNGYIPIDDIPFKVVQGSPMKNGQVRIVGLEVYTNTIGLIEIVNKSSDYNLEVIKLDQYDKPVRDVTFRLVGDNYDVLLEGTGLDGNIFNFEGLKSGRYVLKEVSNPNQYISMDDVVIDISNEGNISINGNPDDSNLVVNENTITYTAINVIKGYLPYTGSKDMVMFIYAPIILVTISIGIGLYALYRQKRGRYYEN